MELEEAFRLTKKKLEYMVENEVDGETAYKEFEETQGLVSGCGFCERHKYERELFDGIPETDVHCDECEVERICTGVYSDGDLELVLSQLEKKEKELLD